MSGETASVSGTSGAGDSEPTGDALTLLTQGKRHLLVKDYSEAVSSLGQACGLLAAKYGETADECGEAFLFYGKALLELARTESGVLGDAIEGEGSGEESDEDADETEEKTEEPEENGKDKTGDEEKSETEETPADKVDSDEKKDDDDAAPTKEDANVQEDEEDVSNLKLSWEMLELAKIIFQRQAKDSQMNLKLAEVYLNLGEVSLESETYDQAIQDLQSCLKIQKENLEEDDRRIAETYYRLGMAYSLNNEFDDAGKQYSNALDLLENRVKNLESKHASGDKPEETDAFYTIEGEIKELNGIIPDVRDKISELKEMKAETVKAVSEMIKEGSAGSSKTAETNAKPIEVKPASNITHLVRKKKKDEENSSSIGNEAHSPEAVPAKVQKSE